MARGDKALCRERGVSTQGKNAFERLWGELYNVWAIERELVEGQLVVKEEVKERRMLDNTVAGQDLRREACLPTQT